MVIENPKFVIHYNKTRYLIFIIGFVSIILFSLMDFFDEKRLGLSREIYIAASVLIFIIVNIYRFLKNYNYVHISIQNDKLIVRYYTLRPLTEKRKSIEIPVSSFAKYEIENATFGLVPYLILYQRIKGKNAKYPGVSLSAFNDEEIKNIKLLLNSIKPSKK